MDAAENRGPIYIGGPDRCGKTTLQAFLASHPNIAIPAVGSNLWSYFYGQFGPLSQPENFERCLDALLHYKHALFLQPDPERLRREFWQGPPTYARLFALLHIHYAERLGKPRWGDQTGLVERYADAIFSAFPQAKIIHMLRDPRDRYEASLALWPDGKGRVGGATARWLYSVSYAQRNLERYPHRYKIIRYETLVAHPEDTLREICAFLQEAYHPEMLLMEGSPGHRDKLRQGLPEAESALPLSTQFIGRYRQVVSREEIAFMQAYAGEQMKLFGYEPDPIQFSPRARLRFHLVDKPLNLGRMLAWLVREKAQHRFPAQIGRKPSSGMIVSNGKHTSQEEERASTVEPSRLEGR